MSKDEGPRIKDKQLSFASFRHRSNRTLSLSLIYWIQAYVGMTGTQLLIRLDKTDFGLCFDLMAPFVLSSTGGLEWISARTV